jgi:glycerol-3-phosphate dehydrogenase (NAD(P)+)
MTPRRIAVLGAGRLGRAVASVIGATGGDVIVWARRELQRRQVKEEIKVPVAAELTDAVDGADAVFFAVPSDALFEVAHAAGEATQGDQIALHGCRGVAEGGELPHQAIRRACCIKKVGALGGPLYLEDLGSGQPLFAVVGSRYVETIEAVRDLVAGTPVKVHGCRDPIGVEVAGALSNVAMIAAGMAEALGLGETARGVLLTHGLSDAERYGTAIGADLNTFAGLAGVGDLIPRRVASTLRNARVGHLVAEGASLQDAIDDVTGAVEGVRTAHEVLDAGARLGLDLPLVRAVAQVLHEGRDARQALDEVLHMDLYLGREAVVA